MPRIRGELFFYDMTSFRPTGWSEAHYLQNQTLTLPQALNRLRENALFRQAMLAPGISIPYLRVSADGVFRDSQIFPGMPPLLAEPLANLQLFPGAGPPPATGTGGPAWAPGNPLFPGDPPDMPWTAILIRGEGGSTYQSRSMFWLAGLPDNLTFSYLRGITTGVWRQAFDNWTADMIANWGFLGQDNSDANPFKPINLVSVVAGVIRVVCPNHGFSNGQMVGIRGVKTLNNVGSYVNRTYQIVKLDDATFELITAPNPVPFTYLQGGFAQARVKALIAYNKMIQRRFGSRKRGRPFDLPIGKARARA